MSNTEVITGCGGKYCACVTDCDGDPMWVCKYSGICSKQRTVYDCDGDPFDLCGD